MHMLCVWISCIHLIHWCFENHLATAGVFWKQIAFSNLSVHMLCVVYELPKDKLLGIALLSAMFIGLLDGLC